MSQRKTGGRGLLGGEVGDGGGGNRSVMNNPRRPNCNLNGIPARRYGDNRFLGAIGGNRGLLTKNGTRAGRDKYFPRDKFS